MNKKIVGVDTYRKTTIQLLFAGIVMLPYLLLKGGFGNEVFSPKTIILILILGIVHTGVSYLLYFGSMDGLRAQTVAISGYIEPVAALVFSALLLKEPLSVTGFIGAVMIIGSAIISESGEQGK
jgi:drug/metabolite transporter (DMT)-like permease